MTKIFAIHGAFSTPNIFNYIQSKIKADWHMFDYSDEINNFEDICEKANEQITKPCHVIGHSMGGLVALFLASNKNVRSITTIASPLNGLDVNMLQTYMSRSSFIRELQRGGRFIRKLHMQEYTMPVQHILSTHGFNPYMTEDNDGVVALSSQRGWAAGTVHEIYANHAEIVQHDSCVKLIKDFVS